MFVIGVRLPAAQLSDRYAATALWPHEHARVCTKVSLSLGAQQVVSCWRQHLPQKSWTELLRVYGIANLLMAGGVLLPKLVQWTPASYQHTRSEVKPPCPCLRIAICLPQIVLCATSCEIAIKQIFCICRLRRSFRVPLQLLVMLIFGTNKRQEGHCTQRRQVHAGSLHVSYIAGSMFCLQPGPPAKASGVGHLHPCRAVGRH